MPILIDVPALRTVLVKSVGLVELKDHTAVVERVRPRRRLVEDRGMKVGPRSERLGSLALPLP